MQSLLDAFVLTFVPLFIVLDAPGNLPYVISLSEGMSDRERRRMVHIAVTGATLVGLVFLFFGRLILSVLGIEVGSFAIAGGLIILVLAIDYMTTDRPLHVTRQDAVVPIGTPLLVGPATITTLLLLASQFPLGIVLLAFVLNMLVSWGIFLLSNQVTHFLGRGGLRAVSKVFDLLLAAIAVNMIIRGLGMVGIFKIAA